MSVDYGQKIAESLISLRGSWPEMIQAGPKGAGGSPVAGSKEPPPPAPIGTLSMRREVCEVLAAWCRVVMDDALDIHGQRMNVTMDGGDAMEMSGWLLTWADFLGAHEAGADAASEISKAARDCASVANGFRVRKFKVGPCIEHGTTDQGERVPCDGTLFALLHSDSNGLPNALRCDSDGSHTWSSTEWMHLGRRIQESRAS